MFLNLLIFKASILKSLDLKALIAFKVLCMMGSKRDIYISLSDSYNIKGKAIRRSLSKVFAPS